MLLSASTHTRRAYWTDAQKWIAFCKKKRIDPVNVTALVVAAWVEEMKKEKLAAKTRNRRLSALASIYDRLRRDRKLDANPFSVADGPKREAAHAERPTPIAEAKTVAAALKLCEGKENDYEAARDAAILRILWVTGARRSSLVEISRERLTKEKESYYCAVPGKRGKMIRLWFAGRAAKALDKLLGMLDASGVKTGAVFRMSTGRPMVERDIWRAVKRRGREVGGSLKPHSFRVAFLTLNPAKLDERQDAAGHASSDTTRLYDRNWRGKRAFMMMPEVEDLEDDNGST